jgi:PAS domain S-box-containing protein
VLAIPPGYASALWVPAGLALMAVLTRGARMWPGVFLGSLAHNLLLSAGSGIPWAASLAISGGIAAGASLQAIAGAALVRRFVGFPTALTQVRDTMRFLGLGGPVACTINASVGISLLAWRGVIPAGAIPFSWFNWWVGDTMGVLLVVPLWLVAVGKPRASWRNRWRTVALPILAMIVAALGGFFISQYQEAARIRADFVGRTTEIARRVQSALDEDIVLLDVIRGHFDAAPETSRQSFAVLTRNVVGRHGSLRAVEWAPLIEGGDRAAFERAARIEDRTGFSITERGADGALRPSQQRPYYAPVQYVEPLPGNEAALGFDLASDPTRRDAIDRAQSTRLPVITRPLHLVRIQSSELRVLAFLPVFGSAAPESPNALAGQPRGFVVGVIALPSLVDAALAGLDVGGISFRITDSSARPESAILYERKQAAEGQPFEDELKAATLKDYQVESTIAVAGGTWRLEFHPTLSFLDRVRTPMPWIVQSSGLLFAGLIGLLLLNLSGRNEEMLREVAARTKELSERNRDLTHEINERERAQAALQKSEQRYRMVIEHAPLMVALVRDGRYLYGNQRYLEALGRARLEDLVGTSVIDSVAPQARGAMVERAASRQQGGSVERILETIGLRADGSEFPMIVYSDATELTDGPAIIAFGEDLTERRLAEAARRESDARFEAAFENSVNGIVIEDQTARIVRVNPAMCALLGYSQEELLERNLYQVTHPEDLAVSEEKAHALWAGLVKSYTLEKRYLHRNGQVVWVVIAVALIRDGSEQPKYLVSQVQDVTEVKAAALALARSEQKLRGLFEASQLGIALTDMQGRYLEFNSAFEHICGYTANELRSLDYWTLTPRSYEAEEVRQLELLKSTGHYGPYEKHYVRKDGSLIPLQLTGVLLKTPDGQSYIWSVVEDISERKRLEAKVASESARHQLFLRNASDGVHILDASARIVEASDSFCDMLGYQRSELTGHDPSKWDARITGSELREFIDRAFSGAVTRFDTLHRRKDGTVFEVEVHVDAFEAGGQRYLYCSARDITELRQLERALVDVTNREQRRLGHDLHDELGQVLTGISMLAGSLAAAEKAAGRPAAGRLRDLEALAREAIGTCRGIAHGLSPLTYQDGNLVRALAEMAQVQRGSAGPVVEFEVNETAPLRLGAEAKDHLYRIAQEAVTNARRHADAGLIRVTLDVQPATVRLEIQDDGKGLAEPAAGTVGMGLSIMKFRAALIGAQLAVQPGEHGGTRVICVCGQDAAVATS